MTPADTAPSWPRLIVAGAALRLSARLLNVATTCRSPRRMGLAAVWLSEQVAVLGWRVLTAR
jgi:hypothetical protein